MYLALATAALLKRPTALHLWNVRSNCTLIPQMVSCFDLPVYNGQEPHDFSAFEPLTFSPLGDVEQERVEGQKYEADAYRVGQEKEVLERSHVNPGGYTGQSIQWPFLCCWVGSSEEEAYDGDSANDGGDKSYTGREAIFGDEVCDGQWISKATCQSVSPSVRE